MRKVMVSEEKWNNKTNRRERIDLYEAWFHQFGNDECGENVVTTIAIVERIDNGQVEVVFPGNIRFVDEINRKCRALTEKQINDIVGAMPGGLSGFFTEWGCNQFARAIESAHGIGE